ncbi:MAG TPA: ABC transporter permease [Candidatus Saccharimonadales bacterium]|nr:ABC transporter permease [Candidatus Saccharimonadales bacterium]
MKLKKIADFGPSIIFLILLLLIWEILVGTNQINSHFLPAPSKIIIALIENWSIIAPHAYQTALETLIGFVIAIILGVTVALLLDLSGFVRKTLYPLLISSQTIPMIALSPLLLAWFGFDLLPKVIMVVISCFFPIAIATAQGLASTDQDLLKLLKSMNASYVQTLRHVRLPEALPQFFAGTKIAATYSITAAIIGEYVGAYQGLGIYMQNVANSHATVLLFAAIFVTTLLSLILFGFIVVLEKICIPWNK